MSGGKAHWDETYRARDETRLSWFQEQPSRSLELIEKGASAKDAPILDVGGGASRLVDALIARGYSDVSVLDISELALDRARARLGRRQERVTWIVGDVANWVPKRRWQIWHDRALFHFLTEEPLQQAYVAALKRATLPGAIVIIAGFALSGPERCSGLAVRRHDDQSLAECLGESFTAIGSLAERHLTPSGTPQDFNYCRFTRQK